MVNGNGTLTDMGHNGYNHYGGKSKVRKYKTGQDYKIKQEISWKLRRKPRKQTEENKLVLYHNRIKQTLTYMIPFSYVL